MIYGLADLVSSSSKSLKRFVADRVWKWISDSDKKYVQVWATVAATNRLKSLSDTPATVAQTCTYFFEVCTGLSDVASATCRRDTSLQRQKYVHSNRDEQSTGQWDLSTSTGRSDRSFIKICLKNKWQSYFPWNLFFLELFNYFEYIFFPFRNLVEGKKYVWRERREYRWNLEKVLWTFDYN